MFKVGDKVSIKTDKSILPNYKIRDGTIGIVESVNRYNYAVEIENKNALYLLYERELELVNQNPSWEV